MKYILSIVYIVLIALFVLADAADATYAPSADVLPMTFTIRDRAGTVITTSLTIGVRVVDQAGNGINNIPMSIEVCGGQKVAPCTSTWINRVTGATGNTVEDGWAVAPSLNDALFRITCGTAQHERAVDGNTATLVVTCVQNPTAVLITTIRATSYLDAKNSELVLVVSALVWFAIAIARRYI